MGVSSDSHSDAEIEIVGTLQPNPIPRSLPEGSTITVRLDMTLRKSDSPLSFYTGNSFITQNQTMESRFRVYRPATDDGTTGWRHTLINALPGILVNVDEDLMTLYPDVTVSVDVATKVYTKISYDGQERKYFFGSYLSTLEIGEKYEMCLGAGSQPMRWLYWGTKEDIIEEYVKGNGHSGHTGKCSRSFRTPKAYAWGELPLLRMVRPIEFTAVE
jgi:hypothetical protein